MKRSSSIVLTLSAGILLSIPAFVGAQQSQQNQQSQQKARSQHSNTQSRPAPTPPRQQFPSHRDIVRTPNYVPRSFNGPAQTQRNSGFRPRPVYSVPPQAVQPPQQPRQPIQKPPIRRPAPVQQPPVRNPRPPQQPVKVIPPNHLPVQRPRIPKTPVNKPPVYPPQTQTTKPRLHFRVPAPVHDGRNFTKDHDGRWYDNGVHLRHGHKIDRDWQRRYFHRGWFYYPYYRPTFIWRSTYFSPFAYYYGVCPPYIQSAYVNLYPPSGVFVDQPVYNGDNCLGFANTGEQNFLDDPNIDSEEPGLMNALSEINEAYVNGNINALVPLVDPNTSIAIYERGAYKYSISANDYLDLTRDAFQDLRTVTFSIDGLYQRANGVFTASGRHIYRDDSGQLQTVYLSFALQDIGGQWTLTQVETAPARYRQLAP